jgi:flagellar assembly protein FliH
MTAAPAKFRFDLDLGHRQERNSVLTESALATLIANARAEGRQQGVAEGERSATAKASQRLASAAQAIADHTAALSAALDDHRREKLIEAVDLAATIGRKLAAHLLARYPTAEIEALIGECLASLDEVPHLVIRCTPELADAVREIALARIATSGFSGRLVVLGDPDVAENDTRIEWAGGGVVRDRAALDGEIDRRIDAFIAAHGGRPTPPPDASAPGETTL